MQETLGNSGKLWKTEVNSGKSRKLWKIPSFPEFSSNLPKFFRVFLAVLPSFQVFHYFPQFIRVSIFFHWIFQFFYQVFKNFQINFQRNFPELSTVSQSFPVFSPEFFTSFHYFSKIFRIIPGILQGFLSSFLRFFRIFPFHNPWNHVTLFVNQNVSTQLVRVKVNNYVGIN